MWNKNLLLNKKTHCLPVMIIFAAMFLAVKWVFLVPIFQSPDEDYHADYIFCLYSKGGLIKGDAAPIAAVAHPFVLYLLKATNGEAVKETRFEKMPPGYGTKAFFHEINKGQPDQQACVQINANPIMMTVYPFAYYALVALWLGLLSCIHHSIIFLFFAARLFSVILLGCALTFSHLSMRELKMPCWQSSLVLAAIAFFPLTSFIGSYIQPDNLSFAVISVCFFLALCWRNAMLKKERSNFIPTNSALILILGVALAVLFLTKYHFFGCAAIAIAAMVIATAARLRIPFARIVNVLAILFIPSIIAALFQLWLSWNCHLPVIDLNHRHWFSVTTELDKMLKLGGRRLATHVRSALSDQYQNNYCLDRTTFQSFWGCFGQNMTAPLIIASISINDSLRSIIEVVSNLIVLLTLISLVKISIVFWRLLNKDRIRSAFYIICSNPLINTYFLFVLLMFIVNILFFPSYFGQGRHWFPLILPIVLAAASFAPRFIRSRLIRQRVFLIIVASWLGYSLIGSYYALGCIKKRYYAQNTQPIIDINRLQSTNISASYGIEDLDYVDLYPTFDWSPYKTVYSLTVPSGKNVHVQGWAVDFPTSSIAGGVLFFVDQNKMYQAAYGFESNNAVKQLGDKKYRFSGFGVLIPTKDLSLGVHTLSMKVVSQDGHLLYNTNKDIKITIR